MPPNQPIALGPHGPSPFLQVGVIDVLANNHFGIVEYPRNWIPRSHTAVVNKVIRPVGHSQLTFRSNWNEKPMVPPHKQRMVCQDK